MFAQLRIALSLCVLQPEQGLASRRAGGKNLQLRVDAIKPVCHGGAGGLDHVVRHGALLIRDLAGSMNEREHPRNHGDCHGRHSDHDGKFATQFETVPNPLNSLVFGQ